MNCKRLYIAHNNQLIIILNWYLIHCVSKYNTDVEQYNFDADQPILIIFNRYVPERVCYQMVIKQSSLSPN